MLTRLCHLIRDEPRIFWIWFFVSLPLEYLFFGAWFVVGGEGLLGKTLLSAAYLIAWFAAFALIVRLYRRWRSARQATN